MDDHTERHTEVHLSSAGTHWGKSICRYKYIATLDSGTPHYKLIQIKNHKIPVDDRMYGQLDILYCHSGDLPHGMWPHALHAVTGHVNDFQNSTRTNRQRDRKTFKTN